MSKYISFEYLTQNNPNPNGVQFKGLFGNRSIGKTHGVLKYVHKNLKEGESFLILRRNKLELNFQPFVQKYSSAFNTEWRIEGQSIVETNEEEQRIIGYFSALSLAERSKNNNYDFPYITHIIVDEVFAEKPNKNEYQQLMLWITTVSRRTGSPFHPVTVWLLGNFDYGYSPILENLNVYAMNGLKQKTENGVYLFSDMPSPEGVVGATNPLIREFEIKEDNTPIVTWNYQKQAFAMYDMGTFMYICRVECSPNVYDLNVKGLIYRCIMRKTGLPPIFVSDYEGLRFVDIATTRLK